MNDIKSARWVLFDVEADSLEATKIHCLSYEDFEGKKETLYDTEGIRHFLQRYDVLVGHNIIRWDIPTLERILDISIVDTLVDTLALAWYLEPQRDSHGLESYGEEFGLAKPKVLDWVSAGIEVYRDRCETDVEINIQLFRRQLGHLSELYRTKGAQEGQSPDQDSGSLWSFLKYLSFKMRCARLQEESGWKFDEEYCRSAIAELDNLRGRKYDELKRVMPRVPVISTYDPPKRQYKADGELSLLGRRWQEKLISRGLPEDYAGTLELVTGTTDPNPSSHTQIKSWLYGLGWVPQTIKVQRDKKTGTTKEIPQVNKERSKGGGLCESVKLLYDKEPNLEHLDSYFVINHRLSILRGFLRDVDSDGLLHANIQGLTNTLRFKHAEIVNLPKPEAKYGKPIRHCLVARDGYELCGADMASLEDRLKQHYIFPLDPDYVNELNKPDYDPHLDLALTAGAVTQEEVDAYKRDGNTKKAVRSTYKNGNYA